MACAPPTLKMRSMPHNAAAATTAKWASPDAAGGVHSTRTGQPAMAAGTASMTTAEGSGAEPAHIYQPGFSFFKAQKVITDHYKMMYNAAKFNQQNGVPYLSLKSFRNTIKKQKEHKMKVVNF